MEIAMKNLFTTSLASLAIAAFVLSGCADSTTSESASSAPATAGHEHGEGDAHDHGEHDHPSEGPHGGDLVELGNDEYHAELVHPHHHDDDAHARAEDHEDDKGTPHEDAHTDDGDHDHAGVTVYILDGAAKQAVAIDAAEITLNLSHDGQPEQFKLAALPADSDPDGKSSRFASADKDLLEHFHEEELDGTLVLTIAGKSYRGRLTHSHGHSEEGHGDHGHTH
jgi:hypothetical protein